MKNKEIMRKIYYENRAINRNIQCLDNISLIGLLARSAKKAKESDDEQGKNLAKAGLLLVVISEDVDIVLIVESITAEFGRQFWEYVKEAGYEHLNKSTGNAQFYRFTSPKSKEYPYMIEIFSRNPDFIILEDDAVLTPLPIDDEISSLSAILLNEAYYELLKTGQMMVDGIPVLSLTCHTIFTKSIGHGVRRK